MSAEILRSNVYALLGFQEKAHSQEPEGQRRDLCNLERLREDYQLCKDRLQVDQVFDWILNEKQNKKLPSISKN